MHLMKLKNIKCKGKFFLDLPEVEGLTLEKKNFSYTISRPLISNHREVSEVYFQSTEDSNGLKLI